MWQNAMDFILMSNSWMQAPAEVVVDGQLNAADDWIVEQVTKDDIVISGEVPFASWCLEKGVLVLGPRGRVFTEDTIVEALAKRKLLSHLRDLGTMTRGPATFK